MRKLLLTFCVFMLAVALGAGGVFAAFLYARGEASPDNKNLTAGLGEFVYDYPPGFTSDLQAILNVAQHDTTYGLNASSAVHGMKKVIANVLFSGYRHNYGYVGSMDNNDYYRNDVYGKDPIESVSMIISFPYAVAGVQTIYMYFVKKSKAELTATAENDILYNVYRATFIQDETTAKDWDLHKLADGSPDVVKGYSPVRNYEGQTDGTKTFGFYAKDEIWQADQAG